MNAPAWGVLRNVRFPPQLRVTVGAAVLVDAPWRDAVEVYRVDASGLESFAGYLSDQSAADRATLGAAWLKAWLCARAAGAIHP